MNCCTERSSTPERLCPDNPGQACCNCLERSASSSAENIAGRLRVINEVGQGHIPSPVVRTENAFTCVII